MKFYPISEAQKKNLVSITAKLRETPTEIVLIERLEKDLSLKGRTTMFVKYKDGKIALFANDVRTSPHREYQRSRNSTSGIYKSIRHFCECAFSKNKNLSLEQFSELLRKEYPNCKICKNETFKSNYTKYRSMIAIKWEFQCIKAPRWAR